MRKSSLEKLDINSESPCWSFYRAANARIATIKFTQPAGRSLTLMPRLSRLLLALANFFRAEQILSDIWILYRGATTVVTDLSVHLIQSNDLASDTIRGHCAHGPVTGPRCGGAGSQDIHGFKFALTLTLIINGVLSSHYSDNEDLADFRRRYSNDKFSISEETEQLMPIGAGFMSLFLVAKGTQSGETWLRRKLFRSVWEDSIRRSNMQIPQKILLNQSIFLTLFSGDVITSSGS
jgi:hypothetical protein